MKIGIDARLLGYRKGGIAEYTRQLINALAKLDFLTRYAILHRFSDNQTYTPASNFHRVNIYTPAHHRWEQVALSIELLPRRLDLLHSPDFIPPHYGARQHLITIHDLHFFHYPQFQTADSLHYYHDRIRWAVQHAAHIFAQTESTKREIVDRLGIAEEKITVHLLGVNETFQPISAEQVEKLLAPYQLPSSYILFVGTLEPRKNIPNLLKAYAYLRSKYKDVPSLILGGQKGWLADESLQAIHQNDLGGSVRWFEDVPFEVLPALYNKAKLLVLPSFHEGFGMPAIEAMACGTPVVVSDRGALPEIVGEYGIYINPDDIESIADGLWQLLSDSDLQEQLRQAGLAHAKRFTWQHTAEIVHKVYQRMLTS